MIALAKIICLANYSHFLDAYLSSIKFNVVKTIP